MQLCINEPQCHQSKRSPFLSVTHEISFFFRGLHCALFFDHRETKKQILSDIPYAIVRANVRCFLFPPLSVICRTKERGNANLIRHHVREVQRWVSEKKSQRFSRVFGITVFSWNQTGKRETSPPRLDLSTRGENWSSERKREKSETH